MTCCEFMPTAFVRSISWSDWMVWVVHLYPYSRHWLCVLGKGEVWKKYVIIFTTSPEECLRETIRCIRWEVHFSHMMLQHGSRIQCKQQHFICLHHIKLNFYVHKLRFHKTPATKRCDTKITPITFLHFLILLWNSAPWETSVISKVTVFIS